MKMLKLLAVIAASFIINACPLDYGYGASGVWLRVENKTNMSFYLDAGYMSISGRVYAKQACKLATGYDGSIPDLTFKGDIGFYHIIDDGDFNNSEKKLIKRISNAASVVTLIEDNRDDKDFGTVGYKIIVTNEMLGITANTGGVQVEYEDNAGGEDDAETPESGAENGGEV
ncbi:MAG: hypothetical protein LBK66_00375 [Spirochaetaceae bacterium]|jgi:hypothetical protein|nr:hypothetical protein [Spirochaetaceae bacterium]